MKKIILMGRSESGKTTLIQALKGSTIEYNKTQYINHYDLIIDTPGEYAETNKLARALALYSYEADVVGLLLSATEPYSLYPPNVAPMANRPVIGIVTQIDSPYADEPQAREWLRLTGADPIFSVSSYTGDGLVALFEYLREPGDTLPWENKEAFTQPREIVSTKYDVDELREDLEQHRHNGYH